MTLLNLALKKAYTVNHIASSLARKTLLSLTVLGLSFSTVGFSSAGAAPTSANSAAIQSTDQTLIETARNKDLSVLADGTYLFGQSPQRDQIGSAYAVFSIIDNKTVGAFYQPNSSFDCFSGQVYPDRMALNVVDSYQQTVHPYSIALTTDGSLSAGSAAPAYTLQGFHHIETLSEQDLDILATCEADFSR